MHIINVWGINSMHELYAVIPQPICLQLSYMMSGKTKLNTTKCLGSEL